MTLNDRDITLAEINITYAAHQKHISKDRSMLSAAKCRPSCWKYKVHMRIFAGVPSERGRQAQYLQTAAEAMNVSA